LVAPRQQTVFRAYAPPFKICESFRQRLILFAQLFGLSLDIRKFIGMARRCER
jgi:hypothetical protein